jgi:hypothetical protein
MINNNREIQIKFHLKDVKILREGKHIRINTIGESVLTIEYHCVWINWYLVNNLTIFFKIFISNF